jgi:hypothetical protein
LLSPLISGAAVKTATQHEVIAQCSELRIFGIAKIHVELLHRRMIASGFDARSSFNSIEAAIGNRLLTFNAGYVSTRLDPVESVCTFCSSAA